FGERDAIAMKPAEIPLRTAKTKRPRVVTRGRSRLPREIGVTDLRERKSVVWDEALAAFVMQQAARGHAATRRSQCSRVGDVEEGLHLNFACPENNRRNGEGRAPYARCLRDASITDQRRVAAR
ncbi:MAG TPA: hypothetical protein VFF93_02635, partial [Luteimonas sp.]|nr:hypothetical protein [Luteimonas sp.]